MHHAHAKRNGGDFHRQMMSGTCPSFAQPYRWRASARVSGLPSPLSPRMTGVVDLAKMASRTARLSLLWRGDLLVDFALMAVSPRRSDSVTSWPAASMASKPGWPEVR